MKLLRLARGWRQLDLAHATGLARCTINRIEQMIQRVSFEDAWIICEVLGTSMDVMGVDLARQKKSRKSRR